jgi:uncharacterized protein YdaU (DUF1376 family)
MSTGNSLAMMPWFARDYLAATRAMRLAERGAYCDLLFYQWEMGELPSDPNRLARLLGADREEFAEIWPAISSKFVAVNGHLVNKRLEEHRLKAITQRQKKIDAANSTNAKRGAQRKPNETLSDTLSATHSGTPPSPSPSPDSKSPLPPLKKGAGRKRRSESRRQTDEATARWKALVKSNGKERDDRVQAAIAKIGGWPRIAQRTERDEPRLIREFCDAYREAQPA